MDWIRDCYDLVYFPTQCKQAFVVLGGGFRLYQTSAAPLWSGELSPPTQQRIQALLERGLQREAEFENRWPALLGTLLET